MAMGVTIRDIAVGSELPAQSFDIERLSMIKYAGASGDFNTIHWSESIAKSVGLPNVIAHGMLTMAIAARVVTDFLGDPGAVVEYGVRFTRPVVVPEDTGATLDVAGRVRSIDSEAGTAVFDIIATVNGETVMAKARVTARLATA
ncbi:MaoC/PaaZ C-terminal domain-containing protein [Jatrophihabitans sp. DSM 45814]